MEIKHWRLWRTALWSCGLGLCLGASSLSAASPTPHAAASPAPTATLSPTPVSAPSASPTPTPLPALQLAEIAPQAQAVLGTLKGLEPGDTPDPVTSSIQQALTGFSTSIDDLREQSSKATANVGSSLDTLRNLQVGWQKLEKEVTDRSDALGDRGKTLESEAATVDKINGIWKNTKADIDAAREAVAKDPNVNVPPEETRDRVGEILYNALLAQTRIKSRQSSVLELQNRVGALLARIDAGQDTVDQALKAAVKTLLVRESPPLWTPDAQPAPDLAGRWHASIEEQTAQFTAFVSQHDNLFLVHAAVFGALLALFLWLRRLVHRWTEDEPHLKRAAPVFDVPVATALVLSFFLMGDRYAGAPSLVHAAVSVAALLPTVILLRKLLARRLSLVLYSLAVFTLLDQCRAATTALPTINRWLFCFEMGVAVGVFLWLIRMQKGGDPASRVVLGRWMPALCGLAVAAFATALLAAVIGYVRLGTLLGTATLQSGYTAVFLYALLRVLDGLTVIGLRVRPVSASRIAQTHRDEVQAQIYNVFRAAAVVLWLKYTLDQLQLFAPLYAALARFQATRVPLGKDGVTLGQLFGFALAIWLSMLISRVVRFFLSEEVYERVNLAPGLPYAISTMVNYLVLLIGFLVALGVLKVELTQITILAGAFSVGLGFGLQNIINNFVSGIILLFERPVKVGDVIQIGDSIGEVRRIGIRASIVRTRDGSDIILPNGNLISNQVTNWTYADRRRSVEIPFNVAAGPDPNHVLQILKTAADREPGTEDRPEPQVYVTAITATGYSVVVRAWTNRYEDWIEVRSELSIALHAALTRENIRLV